MILRAKTAICRSRCGSWFAPALLHPYIFHRRFCSGTRDDKSKTFVFVDGGVTPHNNPAFLLYRMATNPAYHLNWKTGEENLLIVSVGTGAAESMGATASSPNKNIVSTIAGLSGRTDVWDTG